MITRNIAARLEFWTVRAHPVDAMRLWFRRSQYVASQIAGRVTARI